MNDTTNVESAVNLADLANDGLLGGSLVESDSEILLLPGLSRRDRVQFGSTKDMTGWERMNATGLTTGQPENIAIINRTPGEPFGTVYNGDILRMRKPEHLRCPYFGGSWSLAFYPDDSPQVRHFECGQCDNDREWRRVEIAHRYAVVRHDVQTVITVTGFDDVDAVSKWSEAQGDRAKGPRHRNLRWDDVAQGWEMVLTYDGELDANLITLTERDIARKDLVGDVRVCSLTPLAFKAMLSTEKAYKGPSGKSRQSSHFTDWPCYEKVLSTYSTGDRTCYKDGSPPELTEMTSLEKERALLPVEQQADLWAADWWVDTDEINRGTFDEAMLKCDELEPDHELVKAIRDQSRYKGSTALLVDAIRYQSDSENVPYREAYRHVLNAAGRPTPAPICAGDDCDRPAITALGLCLVCNLERGA